MRKSSKIIKIFNFIDNQQVTLPTTGDWAGAWNCRVKFSGHYFCPVRKKIRVVSQPPELQQLKPFTI